MIAVETFAGKKVAVFGLGGSGLATAHALAAGGAEIICHDDNRERVTAAWDGGLPTGDLRVADFAAFDALVLSPGVPLTHPEPHWTVERAKAAGIEIIGDVELFDRERRARFANMRLAAITGTNGKSTVTALTGHLLQKMGVAAEIGGNIGRPVLDLSPQTTDAIVEVSSFQADLAPGLSADVGALLNVTVDHIDRHGSFEAYRAIKERMVEASGVAVVGEEASLLDYARAMARSGRPMMAFAQDDGRGNGHHDFYYDDFTKGILVRPVTKRKRYPTPPHMRDVTVGWAFFAADLPSVTKLGAVGDVASLRGPHNGLNAAAALAIIAALGHDPAQAVQHLESFAGLPHRLEEVGRDGDVVFINDSKATNLTSAITALKSFERIHWIAGGKPKEGGLSSFTPTRYDLRHAYLIGEAADDFNRSLKAHVGVSVCGTLDAAVSAAADAARAEGGGVVLLSPACASYDQFRSFEHRGETFRDLVQAHLETVHG
ncbi:MAG: UDP-N-acetylmuramoyl-L-alanine--D-glutamate ligase [Pseudomonadota bacterium]